MTIQSMTFITPKVFSVIALSFYTISVHNSKSGTRLILFVPGKCTVSFGDGSLLDCIACRYKKCKRFFPGPESMKDVLQKKHSYRTTKHLSPKTTERPMSPDVAEPMESVEEEPGTI